MTRDVNDVMPGSAEDFGIWKKTSYLRFKLRTVSWDSRLEEGSWFLVSPRRDQLESMKCVVHFFKKLCLSLLLSKNFKLKKVIKRFVTEPKESSSVSSVFGFLYVYEYCEHFLYQYEHMYIWRVCNLGRLFLELYATMNSFKVSSFLNELKPIYLQLCRLGLSNTLTTSLQNYKTPPTYTQQVSWIWH